MHKIQRCSIAKHVHVHANMFLDESAHALIFIDQPLRFVQLQDNDIDTTVWNRFCSFFFCSLRLSEHHFCTPLNGIFRWYLVDGSFDLCLQLFFFFILMPFEAEMRKFISGNNYDVRLIVLVWQKKNHLVRCSYKCFRYIYYKSFKRYSGKHYLDYYQLIDFSCS